MKPMRIIKRLHIFILQSFLPLFAMTFFIVLFIVLMQFLWKYIDDLVGKGLSMDVLGELFFYAAVSMVPMALPLAILLASLMTFGNLGERFELTALKASGISLVRVMAPLIVLISGVAVGAFFFQNDVLPKAQVKMWTLLFSMKQKSPEVEIPEGVFYDQIPGYNLFVQHKNQDTGMLYDVMIYDISRGGDNSTILLADSARMAFTKDSRYLYLHLMQGEEFENLREQQRMDRNVPFRRENFLDKEVLIPFDANFNRMDDEMMRRQYVGKNIEELRQTIDSVGHRVDSMAQDNARLISRQKVGGILRFEVNPDGDPKPYKALNITKEQALNLDTLLAQLPASDERRVYDEAVRNVENRKMNLEYRALMLSDEKKSIRRHEIELMKKFTLSVACLIFFFIGAPLGAIIRKGGLGTPLVISVMLFLFYYIIDNTGYKMARDGHWSIWFGMWLSTMVLAPLGAYVTYKAMNDSAVFDKDAYLKFFGRLIGMRQSRQVEMKEVIIDEIPSQEVIDRMAALKEAAGECLKGVPRFEGYSRYWLQGIDTVSLGELSSGLDADVEALRNCRNPMVVNKLMDFPVIRSLWVYKPSNRRWLGIAMMALFPVGLTVWLVGNSAIRHLRHELESVITVAGEIENLIIGGADNKVNG